jgi:D-tyrosyl-tRNA(Tyr) deacylase
VRALLQRVLRASVSVAGARVGAIGPGYLVLLCAEQGDTTAQAQRMLEKILRLRVFPDEQGKMNRNVQNLDGHGQPGGLLVVSQFTLIADTSGGNRPSFTAAAAPDVARDLYDYFVTRARSMHPQVETGVFAADMQIELVNDGPVTIPLHIPP